MNKFRGVLISIVTASFLLSGCGDGGSSATPIQKSESLITVERGPLLDANVSDAQGQIATERGNGQYAFSDEIVYPITAVGGYIDIDRNGKIDAGEVENNLKLQSSEGDVVTLATTLALDEKKAEVLKNEFGLTQEEIEKETPSKSTAIEAFSDTLYAYSIENGLSNPSQITTEQLKVLATDFKEKKEAYKSDGADAGKHEAVLVSSLHMVTLDNADAEAAQERLEEKLKMPEQAGQPGMGSHSSESQMDSHSSESQMGSHSSQSEMGSHSSESQMDGSHSSQPEMGGQFGQDEMDSHSSESQMGSHSSESQMDGQFGQGEMDSHSSESQMGSHSSESEMGGQFGQRNN